MNFRICVAAVLIVTGSNAFAQKSSALAMGAGSSGGGHILVCGPSTAKTAQFFDYWEGTEFRRLQTELGPGSSFQEKVEYVLNRLSKLNPTRAALYKKWANEFEAESRIANVEIPYSADIGAVAVPEGCSLAQGAIQQSPDLPGDSRYIINKNLWEMLDSSGQAGLVLHELILREVREGVDLNSTKYVRYFNALLASQTLSRLSLAEYIELVRKTQIQTADAQFGVPISLVECDPNKTQCHETDLIFGTNGHVRKARLAVTPFEVDLLGTRVVGKGFGPEFQIDLPNFNYDGSLKDFLLVKGQKIHLSIGSYQLEVEARGNIIVSNLRDASASSLQLSPYLYSDAGPSSMKVRVRHVGLEDRVCTRLLKINKNQELVCQ